MKLAVPDMISTSYFPALAAVELGFFAREGLDVELEMIFPVTKAYEALRDDTIEFVAGSAHAALSAFPEWRGVKLLAAQAQGMYWFLVMHADRKGTRGNLDVVRNSRIGAAPWVEMGLRVLLADAGFDLVRDGIEIVPISGSHGVNFGLNAAQALEDRRIDGFWANGMGAEEAVRRGAGTMILDVRRGDGPSACFDYTMASLATSDRLIARSPDVAAAAVRALMGAQTALKRDVSLAAEVGKRLFPEAQAALTAELIARDLPYYDPVISRSSVESMNAFARRLGLLKADVPYEDVVAVASSAGWVAPA
jgi:NitT/TauT family transport system substrate-binding protein